ncbi:hypothetical protein [uncultured Kordia sp.]|uniref:hypothetical protein n=1 Tax=uncultured Kordia sp. TaxID=507699 RepID=UPI00260E450B|nr:hypothetical protein [uncultured Kordia sp.]
MDIKEAFLEAGGYFAMAIVVIGSIFISSAFKSPTINWTLIGIGAFMVAFPVIYIVYLLFAASKIDEKGNERYNDYLHEFKQTANRIPFDLGLAIIQKRNRYETQIVPQSNAASLNAISGHGHHNEEIIEHTYCKVTFNFQYHGETISLEEIIPKDDTTLRMHFYMQKETIIYINPFDAEEYYIDLEFLEN